MSTIIKIDQHQDYSDNDVLMGLIYVVGVVPDVIEMFCKKEYDIEVNREVTLKFSYEQNESKFQIDEVLPPYTQEVNRLYNMVKELRDFDQGAPSFKDFGFVLSESNFDEQFKNLTCFYNSRMNVGRFLTFIYLICDIIKNVRDNELNISDEVILFKALKLLTGHTTLKWIIKYRKRKVEQKEELVKDVVRLSFILMASVTAVYLSVYHFF